MAFSKLTIVFLALVAVSMARPQFGFGNQRPFGGGFFNPGSQANAGGFTNSNSGPWGPSGGAGGFGSSSGPNAAFATGSAQGGMGMGPFGHNFQGQGSGTAFGF